MFALLVNVSAGREGTAGAGEDYAADCLVRFDLLQQPLDFQHHRPVHRIQFIGSVQRDCYDAAVELGEDGLVAQHVLLPAPQDIRAPDSDRKPAA